MTKLRLTAPCLFGLEKVLSFEIKKAGGENLAVSDGRIFFDGDYSTIARCNICCTVAERIGIVLAQAEVQTFDDVFDSVKEVAIEEFAAKNDILHVMSGHSLNSQLTSIPVLQRTIKKALVNRMKAKHNIEVLPECGSELRISFLIFKNQFTLILDTSGEGLHKRGYRERSNAAPIKETLAAGIIDLARVRAADAIVDPFCGSGTILIEAAFKALRIAPCLNRSFSAMNWSSFPREAWTNAYDEAKAAITAVPDFCVQGYDIDREAVRLTMENAQKAGVAKYVKVQQQPVSELKAPDNAKIICNPPYAERMLEDEEARKVYADMGETMLPVGGKQLYIICAHPDFEKCFGKKADKNRKLYNGKIQARLLMYGI